MKIIGVCGFAGAGKDTFANYLGYKKLSFAAPLKDAVSALYGWNRALLEGDTTESREFRETPDVFWSQALGRSFTPRTALQETGTKMREINSNIFVLGVKKRLEPGVIITDCRYPNEMRMIREAGGVIIHIARNLPPWYDLYKAGVDVNHELHESEVAWIRCKHDAVIHNNNLDDLKLAAMEIKN